jgi:hypothetical protein
MTNGKHNDPLAKFIAPPGYMNGYRAGRAAERAKADKEIQKLIKLCSKSADEWRVAYKKLLKKTKPPLGLFGLQTGSIVLRRKYKTMQEAEAARDEIYKPEQRGSVEIIAL